MLNQDSKNLLGNIDLQMVKIEAEVKKWKHLADENASLLDRLHASDVVEYLADALRIAKGLDQPEMKLSPS